MMWSEIAKSCSCMKYWQCVNAGGVPHSYCGINQICCMDPPPRSSSSSSSSSSARRAASNDASSIDTLLDPNEADSIIFSTTFNRLNAPVKEANCGVKGPDSLRDGISDAGEWGWHVRPVIDFPSHLSSTCVSCCCPFLFTPVPMRARRVKTMTRYAYSMPATNGCRQTGDLTPFLDSDSRDNLRTTAYRMHARTQTHILCITRPSAAEGLMMI